jgi:hypothetical protein
MVNFQIRDEMPGACDDHHASGSPNDAGNEGNLKGDGLETAKKKDYQNNPTEHNPQGSH